MQRNYRERFAEMRAQGTGNREQAVEIELPGELVFVVEGRGARDEE
jgi:hypothetical protein